MADARQCRRRHPGLGFQSAAGLSTFARSAMSNEALVLDLVEWVAAHPREYSEVMNAWRTSCPRLTIWEDAVDAGLVARDGTTVCATSLGMEFLRTRRSPAV